jgi:hypothetical protein
MLDTLYNIFQQYGLTGLILVTMGTVIVILGKQVFKNIKGNVNNRLDTLATTITDNMSKQNQTLIDSLNKQNEKLSDSLTNQNTQLLEFITNQQPVNKQKHDEMFKERLNTTSDINMKLKEICLTHGAFFAAIFEFHNTSTNLCGVPFAKFSCNFEYVEQKKPRTLLANVQSFPFSMIEPVVSDIMKTCDSRQVLYKDIAALPEEFYSVYNIFLAMPSKLHGLIANAMWDNNENMIGLLIIGYKTELPDNIQTNEIKIDTTQLTSIVNLRYKYDSK